MMTDDDSNPSPEERVPVADRLTETPEELPSRPVDPTRYGDWEKNGRCIDFRPW